MMYGVGASLSYRETAELQNRLRGRPIADEG
jgi:hypothetical protein